MGIFDAKSAAIGSTRILCEAPDVLVREGDTAPWKALGAILINLLGQSDCHWHDVERNDAVCMPDDFPVGYDATFSKLHFGSQKNEDAFQDIQDVRQFALSHLQQLAEERPPFKELVCAITNI